MGAMIQLGGSIKFGATATTTVYTGVSKLVLHLGVNKVERKPTFDDPRVYGRQGARVDTIEVVGEADMNDAAGFWTLFLAQFQADAPVFFDASFRPGAVSATNQQWSGSFLVDGLDIGGEVGTEYETSRTFDLIAVQGPVTAP